MPAAALAQPDGGDARRGHALARRECTACHSVEAEALPASHPGVSFAAIANMKSTTTMAIAAFLTTPHPRMPNYKLSRDQIRDITAYIMSLRQH